MVEASKQIIYVCIAVLLFTFSDTWSRYMHEVGTSAYGAESSLANLDRNSALCRSLGGVLVVFLLLYSANLALVIINYMRYGRKNGGAGAKDELMKPMMTGS
jgi:hypothetical protein